MIGASSTRRVSGARSDKSMWRETFTTNTIEGFWSLVKRGLDGVYHSVCATLSHMEIGIRELRNHTAQVIDAVQAGERVVLTVHGEPIADIVPHARRGRWLPGPWLAAQLADKAADSRLQQELEQLTGQTVADL